MIICHHRTYYLFVVTVDNRNSSSTLVLELELELGLGLGLGLGLLGSVYHFRQWYTVSVCQCKTDIMPRGRCGLGRYERSVIQPSPCVGNA